MCEDYTICNQAIFLNSGNSHSFIADAGVIYTIRISNSDQDVGFFEISNDCRLPLENDFCSDPIEISCDQSITGNTDTLIKYVVPASAKKKSDSPPLN